MTSSHAPAPPAVRESFILIVDDHPLVRHGLASLVGPQSDLAVCGEAATADQALKQIAILMPDLAIVDISLKNGMNGLDLIKILAARHSGLLMLVLSTHHE